MFEFTNESSVEEFTIGSSILTSQMVFAPVIKAFTECEEKGYKMGGMID